MAKIINRKAGRPAGSKNKEEFKKPGKGKPKWSMQVEEVEAPKKTFGRPKKTWSLAAAGDVEDVSELTQGLSTEDRHGLAKKTLQEAAFNKLKAPNNPNRTKNGFTEGNKYSTGRPLGSKHKTVCEIEKMGDDNALFAMQQMIDWMKEGNPDATRFLLERVYRIRKGLRRYLGHDGQLRTIEDVNHISEHVVKMMADGEMSAEEAAEYGKVFEQRLKIIVETTEIQKYVELKTLVDSIRDMRK